MQDMSRKWRAGGGAQTCKDRLSPYQVAVLPLSLRPPVLLGHPLSLSLSLIFLLPDDMAGNGGPLLTLCMSP